MKRIKITKFICSYCGREFSEEEKCAECEAFHEVPKKIGECEYDPSNKKGALTYPKTINVEMSSGNIGVYRFVEEIKAPAEEEQPEPTEAAENEEEEDTVAVSEPEQYDDQINNNGWGY